MQNFIWSYEKVSLPKQPLLLGISLLLLILPFSSSFSQRKVKQKANKVLKETPKVEIKEHLFKAEEKFKVIKLQDVLAQGLSKNFDQERRVFEDKLLDLSFQDTSDGFWWPDLKLQLALAPHKLATLRPGSRTEGETTTEPSGTLSLEIGDYTIYNWGKDYLAYLNKKSTYNREKEKLKERKRDLKHELIVLYFHIFAFKEIEKMRKVDLKFASFIYRLNREKKGVNKISEEEFLQSRAEYLRSQMLFREAQNAREILEEQLVEAISDPAGTRYFLKDELVFKRLQTPLEEALRLAGNFAPPIRDGLNQIERSKRSYELAVKENLPLPKFDLKLGAYKYRFSNDEAHSFYEVGPSNSNVELVATLNATWQITGPGGLFNSRKTHTKLVEKNLALKTLQREVHFTGTAVRRSYKKILFLQDLNQLLKSRVSNLKTTFHTILDNYRRGKTRFGDFSQALRDLTDAQIKLINTQFEHLKYKVSLAQKIGIEDFPGENFERLAQEKKEEK